MALQTSGQISLNEIHIEAGGSTGTACTINDTDIRAIHPTNPASGDPQDFADYYGASSGPSIGADWPPSDTSAVMVTPSGSNAYAGLSGFYADGTFEWFNGTGYVLLDYLTQTGGTPGNDFYIRRTAYTGTLITNLTTTWTNINQKYWAYVSATSPGTSMYCSGVTIAIATDSSGSNEVTWTGTMSAIQEAQ